MPGEDLKNGKGTSLPLAAVVRPTPRAEATPMQSQPTDVSAEMRLRFFVSVHSVLCSREPVCVPTVNKVFSRAGGKDTPCLNFCEETNALRVGANVTT